MVLRTLSALGPLHGYGIARRIERVSGDEVLLNQGTIYASLMRLQQRGRSSADLAVSNNNRRAKYSSLTKKGANQLVAGTPIWDRIIATMGRVRPMENGGGDQ